MGNEGAARKNFCRAYLRTLDPQRAAEEVGLSDGFELLKCKTVQRQLSQMRETAAAQICREDALRRLAELAFGRANDGVSLALHSGSGNVEAMDLAAVAECKVKTDGSVEMKFIDRVRALEALCGLLGGGAGNEALDFFRALEDAGEG